MFEFLDEPEEAVESNNLVKLSSVKGEVEFDNVVFGYKTDQTIIKGLSAHIKPGQRVAIVGPTGAGKTTLVNLLMRFYEINNGSIKIDDVDIRKMKRSDVRQMFGMVLQDTWLFKGPSKRTSATQSQTPPMRRLSLQLKRLRRTSLSSSFLGVTTPW